MQIQPIQIDQYPLYCLEKNITARITLAGGAGRSRNGLAGGQGGKSIFEYTFKRGLEYVIKIGSQSNLTGGSNGGGSGAFLYEKARIIAVCGGGGGAGVFGGVVLVVVLVFLEKMDKGEMVVLVE
jgi:hypothetical protein